VVGPRLDAGWPALLKLAVEVTESVTPSPSTKTRYLVCCGSLTGTATCAPHSCFGVDYNKGHGFSFWIRGLGPAISLLHSDPRTARHQTLIECGAKAFAKPSSSWSLHGQRARPFEVRGVSGQVSPPGSLSMQLRTPDTSPSPPRTHPQKCANMGPRRSGSDFGCPQITSINAAKPFYLRQP
jgi:hypothetical protein